MYSMNFSFHTVATLFMVLLLSPAISQAAITTTPLLIDRTVEVREMFSEQVTLTNNGTTPARVFASVHQITIGDGGEIVSFVPPSMSDGTTSITTWIAVDRRRIELAPGETRTIPVNFQVNPNAQPGLYHAFIGFGSGSNRDEAEAKTLQGNSAGVLARIAIDDGRVEMLRLSRFTIDRFVTTVRDNTLLYSITNTGDLPLTPAGEIIIFNTRGEEVAALALNASNQTLASGETIDFTEQVPSKGLFGKYKAFLTIEYGSGQPKAIHDTAFFYATPFSYLVALFVGLFVFTLSLLLLWGRGYRHRGEDHDGHVVLYVRNDVVSERTENDINLKHDA